MLKEVVSYEEVFQSGKLDRFVPQTNGEVRKKKSQDQVITFLKHSCKKTAFFESVHKFCPKSIKDEIMGQPVSEILHTSIHCCKK